MTIKNVTRSLSTKKKSRLALTLPVIACFGAGVFSTPRSHASTSLLSNLSRRGSAFYALSIQTPVPDRSNSDLETEKNYRNPFAAFSSAKYSDRPKKKQRVEPTSALTFLKKNGFLNKKETKTGQLSGDIYTVAGRKHFAHEAAANHCHQTWGTYLTTTTTYYNATNCASLGGTWETASSNPVVSSLSIQNKTSTSFDLAVTMSKASTVYAVLLETSKPAPNSAQVIAGTDGSDNAAFSTQSAAVSNSGTLNFTGLNASESYIVYVVGRDGSNNISSTPAQANPAFETGLISDVGTWKFPKVRTDDNGDFYVAHKNTSSNGVIFKKWNGSGFTNYATLSAADVSGRINLGWGNPQRVDYEFDSSGNMHVIFNAGESNMAVSNDPFHGVYDGSSWTIQLITNLNYIDEVDLFIDPNDDLHVSYKYDNGSFDDVVGYSTNKSGSWVSSNVVTGGSGTDEIHDTHCVADSSGNAYIIYRREDNQNNAQDNYYLAGSSDSFASKTKILDGKTDTKMYRLAGLEIDSSGDLHYAYSNSTDAESHYVTNASGSWVSTEITHGSHATVTAVDMRLENSTFYIASYQGSNYFFNSYDGSSFTDGFDFTLEGSLNDRFAVSSGADRIMIASEDSSAWEIHYHTAEIAGYVSAVAPNTAPTVTGLASDLSVLEDSASNLDLSTVVLADADGDSLTVTLAASAGTLSASSGGSVTVGGSGTATLTLSGTEANINTFIDTASNIQYTSASNASGDNAATLSITPNDGTENGTAANANIDITEVNDEPTLTAVAANPTFTEGGAAASLFGSASASTIESGQTLMGFTLTVTNVNDGSSEILNADGTSIALTNANAGTTATNSLSYLVSVSGSTATVSFTAGTLSTAALQTLVNALSYQNNAADPDTSNRVISITSLQDSGGSANSGDDTAALSLASTVTMVGVNDEPSLSASASNPAFTENGSAATLFSSASASTVETGQTFSAFTLTVTNVNDGSNERLNVDGTAVVLTNGTSGTSAGSLSYSVSVSGTTATVTFSGGALSSAALQTLVNAISYENTSNDPNTSNRVVTLTSVQDSGGTANSGDDTTALALASTASVVSVNDEPTLTAVAANPTFTEGGAAASLFGSASASTIESGQTLTGFTLTVTNVNDGSSEILNADGTSIALTNANAGTTATNSLSYSVSVSGSTATLSFTAGTLSAAALQAIVDSLSYENTADALNTSNRVITLSSLQDSGGTANGGDDSANLALATTVSMVDANDEPTLSATGANPTFTEDGSAVVLFSDAAADTIEVGQSFSSLSLTITNISDGVSEQLSIDGSAVTLSNGESGTTVTNALSFSVSVSGTTATLTLSGGSLSELELETLVEGISYLNASNNPSIASNRVATLTSLTDSGGTSGGGDDTASLSVVSTISLTAANDNPNLSGLVSSITALEESASDVDLSALSFSDVDSSGTATLILSAGSGQLAASSSGGVTASGSGTATLSLSGSYAAINSFLDTSSNVQYTGGSNISGASADTLSVSGNDGDGSGNVAFGNVAVDITDVNDEPSLTAIASNPTFTEGGAASSLFNSTAASTLEAGQVFSGFTLSISNLADGSNEALGADGSSISLVDGNTGSTTDTSITYSVSVVSSTATVSFTGASLSAGDLQTLVNSINYLNNSDNPSTASARVVTITSVSDSGGTANGGDDTASLSIASSISISAENDPPLIAEGTSVLVNMDEDSSPTSFAVSLSASDPDTASASLTWTLASAAGSGSAAVSGIGASPVVSYTPSANYNGSDSFVVQVSDGTASDTITVNLSITAQNDAPSISGTPLTTVAEDSAYSFTPGGADIDSGDSLTYSISNAPSWATFDTASGELSGTPANEHVGSTDNIVISISDGTVSTSLAGFSLEVTNTNDDPVIDQGNSVAVSMSEDSNPTAFSVIVSGSDVDVGDSLSWSLASAASNGTATVSGSGATPTVSYTPNSNYNGSDSFSVQLSDGVATDNIAVNLTINPENDDPTGINLSATSVNQSAGSNAVVGSLSSEDVDTSDSHTYNLVAGAGDTNNGSFNISANTLRANDAASMAVGNYTVRVQTTDGSTSYQTSFTIAVNDNVSASISSVTLPPNDTYNIGDDLNFVVTFSEVITVDPAGGQPTLQLVVGSENRTATYVSGSGSTDLLFTYSIVEGDLDEDGISFDANAVAANGATLQDASGNDASLGFAAGSLAAVLVDGVRPVVSEVQPVTTPTGDTSPAYQFSTTEAGSLTFTGSCGSVITSATSGNNTLNLSASDNSSALADNVFGDCALTVTDSAGNNSLALSITPFTVDTTAPDVNTLEPLTVTEGASETIAAGLLNASDAVASSTQLMFTLTTPPDNGELLLNDAALNTNDTFTQANIDSGLLHYHHDGSETSNDSFNFTATDVVGNTARDGVNDFTFNITVTAANDAPSITEGESIAVDMSEDSAPTAFSVSISATDADLPGDTLSWSLASAAANGTALVTGSGLTPSISYLPTANFAGNDSFVVSVSDGTLSDAINVNVSVSPVNDAPSITGSPLTNIDEDSTYRFTPVAGDIDSNGLQFTVQNLPGWATFSTSTGELSGVPENADVGVYPNILITVSDGELSAALPAFNISVSNTNDAPTITGAPPVTVNEDSIYSFVPLTSDVDANSSLSFSATNLPSWLAINEANGELSGTPLNDDVGVYEGLVVSVSDGLASASLPAFAITVVNVNDAPTISGTPETVAFSGRQYQFVAVGSDIDLGDTLSYSITGLPGWASFDSAAGTLLGTPADDDVGTYTLGISVSDGELSASLPTFTLEVLSGLDTDGDSVPDSQELVDGTDPNDISDYKDEIPPQLSAPGDLVIDAVALRTLVTTQQLVGLDRRASDSALQSALSTLASDNITLENCCSVSPQGLNNGRLRLPPGRHEIVWQAVDLKGNVSEAIQLVDIRPFVSFSKDQTTVEGGDVDVRVILSGNSPHYPLQVPYVIGLDGNDTADENDHDLLEGSVTFQQGETEASISFNVLLDDILEGDETLTLALDDETTNLEDLQGGFDPDNPDINDINAGSKPQFTLQIVERNIPPAVSLALSQDGLKTIEITADGGQVEVIATVSDANFEDTLSLDWSATDIELNPTSESEESWSFDPSNLAEGTYTVALDVTDQSDTANASLYFTLMQSLPVLDATTDSDGDGIDDATEGTADSDEDGIADYLDNITAPNVLPETLEDADGFLLECEPGIRCRLGQFALGSSTGGARLTNQDVAENEAIVEDEAFDNTSSIFDFELRDLPDPGQTVRVVIPLDVAVPANAVYRKYQNGLWMNFVENANNEIHSSQGELGFCPPPGDELWQPGLTEGHFCVQLTLEDGGPNDADGTANSSIEDPGYVGVEAVEVVEVFPIKSSGKGGGGGSTGLPFLLALAIWQLVKVRGWRKRVEFKLMTIAGLFTILSVGGHAPQADATDWSALKERAFVKVDYLAVNGGQSSSDFERAMDDLEGFALSNYDVDRSGWRILGGLSLSPNWAVDFGYMNLGEVSVDFDVNLADASAVRAQLEDAYPHSSDGWIVGGHYGMRVKEKLRFEASLSAYWWDGNVSISEQAIKPDMGSGVAPLLGIAANYQLHRNLALGLGLEQLRVSGENLMIGAFSLIVSTE